MALIFLKISSTRFLIKGSNNFTKNIDDNFDENFNKNLEKILSEHFEVNLTENSGQVFSIILPFIVGEMLPIYCF